MSFIPLTELNWYPAIEKGESFQAIKGKFHFLKVDENFLERLNCRIRELDWIMAQAGSLLRDPPNALSNKQIRLLKFVKLSRFLKKYEIAASNAISILCASGFSLSYLDLKMTSIPEAKLERAVLDDVDLSNANLDQANLAQSSLNRAILEGVENLHLGQYPILKHPKEVLGATTTSDDQYLISSDGEALYKWDLKTGVLLSSRKFTRKIDNYLGGFFKLLISKDGQFIYMTHPYSELPAEAFDFQSLKSIQVFQSDRIKALVFFALVCKSQFLLLVTYDGGAEGSLTKFILWKPDVNLAQEPFQKPYRTINVENAFLGDICLSPIDDSIIATFDRDRKCIHLYRLPDMSLTQKIPNIESSNVKDLQFFPTGTKLLFSRQSEVFELDIATGKETQILQEKKEGSYPGKDTVGNLHFLPNSPVFTYSVGKKEIRFWDIEKSKEIGSISIVDSNILTVYPYENESFPSERGDFLIQMIRNHEKKGKDLLLMRISDLFAQKSMAKFPEVVDISFSADSQFLQALREDSLIHQFDVRTGRNIGSLEFLKLNQDPDSTMPNNLWIFKQYYQSISRFSMDGDFLVVGKGGGEYTNYPERRPGYLNFLPMHPGVNYCHLEDTYDDYALSSDSKHVILIKKKQQIEVWDIASKKRLGLISNQSLAQDPYLPPEPFRLIPSKSFFPIGYAVIVRLSDEFNQHPKSYSLWEFNFEAQTSKKLYQFKDVKNIAFRGDHTLIILDDRGLIKEWDCKTSKETECIRVEGILEDFAVSPTENFLVACSFKEEEKRTLTAWDMHSRDKPTQKEIPAQISKMRFSPDGNYLAAWGKNSDHIQVWEINANTFRLLWRIPQTLSLLGVKVLNLQKMNAANQALISQFSK